MVVRRSGPENERAAIPVCVTTRLRLRGPRALLHFLRSYWRVRRTLRDAPGLLYASVSMEAPLTFHILSIWQSEAAMWNWVGIPEHVHAVHAMYGRTREVWSGRWRLQAVSPSARRWSAAPPLEQEDADVPTTDPIADPWRTAPTRLRL